MEPVELFVVGAGLMGSGIAQVAAMAGCRVRLHDVSMERLQAGLDAIRESLGRLLAKEKITRAEYDDTLAGVTPTTELQEASSCDLAIEAVFEDLGVKSNIFHSLDRICSDHAILATNTSAIPITSIASVTLRPDKVVGIHFFSPVPIMRLCEIIPGVMTSAETMETAGIWAEFVGKTTITLKKDHAGFLTNRLYLPSVIEAIHALEAGVASPGGIDTAMRLGYNHPMGPLELTDMTGVDILCNAMLAIYQDTGDPKFCPPPLMRRMVAAGLLGRKTGKGFYDYSSGDKRDYWEG